MILYLFISNTLHSFFGGGGNITPRQLWVRQRKFSREGHRNKLLLLLWDFLIQICVKCSYILSRIQCLQFLRFSRILCCDSSYTSNSPIAGLWFNFLCFSKSLMTYLISSCKSIAVMLYLFSLFLYTLYAFVLFIHFAFRVRSERRGRKHVI